MSSHRKPPRPHWTKGRGFCRWCGEAVLKPDGQPSKRQWHPQCVTDYFLASTSTEQRKQVFARDKGICAGCGEDAEALHRIGRQWSRVFWWLVRRHYDDQGQRHGYGIHQLVADGVRAMEKARGLDTGGSAWQADHIRPLVDGGGLDLEYFKLANLQTLCTRCHKAKSAREAAERAAARKPKVPEMQINLL